MFIVLFFRGQPGFILWPATINWGLLFILFKSFRGQGLIYCQFKVPGTLFVDIPKFSGAARVGVRVAVVVAGDRVAGALCAADGGARKASIGASVEYTEALIEDAYRVVHVGGVVVGVIALAGGEARLEINSI